MGVADYGALANAWWTIRWLQVNGILAKKATLVEFGLIQQGTSNFSKQDHILRIM